MIFLHEQPYHSSTTSLLSSEGPKSLTRDNFFVDRVDQGVTGGDEYDYEDHAEQQEEMAEELPEINSSPESIDADQFFPEINSSSNQKKGEKTMQVLGMSPPVSEARIQGGNSIL